MFWRFFFTLHITTRRSRFSQVASPPHHVRHTFQRLTWATHPLLWLSCSWKTLHPILLVLPKNYNNDSYHSFLLPFNFGREDVQFFFLFSFSYSIYRFKTMLSTYDVFPYSFFCNSKTTRLWSIQNCVTFLTWIRHWSSMIWLIKCDFFYIAERFIPMKVFDAKQIFPSSWTLFLYP